MRIVTVKMVWVYARISLFGHYHVVGVASSVSLQYQMAVRQNCDGGGGDYDDGDDYDDHDDADRYDGIDDLLVWKLAG